MIRIPAKIADRDTLYTAVDDFIAWHLTEEKKFAVVLININHFRQININYGYRAGDRLLAEFGERLQQISRPQDFIARVGNSEFIMVLPEILNQGHATLAANKLLGTSRPAV